MRTSVTFLFPLLQNLQKFSDYQRLSFPWKAFSQSNILFVSILKGVVYMAITDQSMERNYTNGARILLSIQELAKINHELIKTILDLHAEKSANKLLNKSDDIDDLTNSQTRKLKHNLNRLSEQKIKGDISVRLIKASASQDVANRLKRFDVGFVELSHSQNGMSALLYSSLEEGIVNRELANLEKEKAAKIVVEPKTLEQMNTSRKGSVISTISGLSDYETKLFAEAAARRQITISINNIEKNNNVISYMSAESSKMDKVISDVALEKSGKTGEQQETEYGKYLSKIDELSKLCTDKKSFYIASVNRPNNFIEVNENGFSSIKANGIMIKSISQEKVDLDDAYGIGKLATQMSAFNNPVFLSEEEFNDIDNRDQTIKDKSSNESQEYNISSKVKAVAFIANDLGYSFSSLKDLQSDKFKDLIENSDLPESVKERTIVKIQQITTDSKHQKDFNDYLNDYTNTLKSYNRFRSIEPEIDINNDYRDNNEDKFDLFAQEESLDDNEKTSIKPEDLE